LQFQVDDRIWIESLRQWNKVPTSVRHRHDSGPVHGRRPQLGSFRQAQPEVGISAALDEIVDVRQDLALLRYFRAEHGAIHDLAQRIALHQWAQRQLQIKGLCHVVICGKNRCIEKQSVFRRHFPGFQQGQTGRNFDWPHLELVVADDEGMALFGLSIERPRARES